MTLSTALETFEDSLTDIRNALAINIKHDLDALPPIPPPHCEWEGWIWDGVRALQIQEITGQRLATIRRIETRKSQQNSPFQSGITDEDKQRAKETPIGEIYIGKLTAKGTQGLCPFHEEKTPSFHINKKKNTWRCYGCDTFGDSIDFVMKRDSITFLQAIKTLV